MERKSIVDMLKEAGDSCREMSSFLKEQVEKGSWEMDGVDIPYEDEEILKKEIKADMFYFMAEGFDSMIQECKKGSALSSLVWVEVLTPFRYCMHDHVKGDIIQVDLRDLNGLVRDYYVKIVVNHKGENKQSARRKDGLQ
ncbi:hypothetical protein 015DV002_59 [Bacillus phage 015DV002]|nr:hypothetical protein 015DV002_59 [Bacillus phage 015DV002]